jgi:hypothetical protein
MFLESLLALEVQVDRRNLRSNNRRFALAIVT